MHGHLNVKEFFTSDILYSSLFYNLTGIITKNHKIINRWVIPTRYKYICILAGITLKMVT